MSALAKWRRNEKPYGDGPRKRLHKKSVRMSIYILLSKVALKACNLRSITESNGVERIQLMRRARDQIGEEKNQKPPPPLLFIYIATTFVLCVCVCVL